MRVCESSGVFVAVALLASAPALAQSGEEAKRDLVHSDLPIFGHGGENEWPRHFDTEDSFGCGSRVELGRWVFREAGAEAEVNAFYVKYNGVFDCWANLYRGNERARLDLGSYKSFFILLDTVEVDGSELELWAVQIGARPGSDYLLFSRAPGNDVIKDFTMLQTACPDRQMREGGNLDGLATRYCAINSRDELVLLALRMAQRPPLGALRLVAGDAEASE